MADQESSASVVAVSRAGGHDFSKPVVPSITLLAGIGVRGDAHAGATVQHRYLVARDPRRPNLRQVHLMPAELFAELAKAGFTLSAGQLGENVTTSGLDLITLPLGARLLLGAEAIVEITGLRSPCSLINRFHQGLMKACISKDDEGRVVRKTGVMGIVIAGGEVRAGDAIRVEYPSMGYLPLDVV